MEKKLLICEVAHLVNSVPQSSDFSIESWKRQSREHDGEGEIEDSVGNRENKSSCWEKHLHREAKKEHFDRHEFQNVRLSFFRDTVYYSCLLLTYHFLRQSSLFNIYLIFTRVSAPLTLNLQLFLVSLTRGMAPNLWNKFIMNF
jgi:hypothetical protein